MANIIAPRSLRFAAAFLLLLPAGALDAQTPDWSLDSLLNAPVSAASKYKQSSTHAPASITVLTAEDIRDNAFTNLEEALESVRGFYVSNDRNYPYLGVRGFSRPADYNNRVLLLVDGHTLNEQTWGGAPTGTDFPINLDAIERIEIVRGPGSALYGTSAMFAVVNIVTKTGIELDATRISARGGNDGMREAAIVSGKPIGARGSFAVSGMIGASDGGNIYFPEYDAPQSNFGIVRGQDWERRSGAIATISWGDIAARAGWRTRDKGIPTASYGSAFGDPRTQTRDAGYWGELSAKRVFRGKYQVQARGYLDGMEYHGVYPEDDGPAYTDFGASRTYGAEAMLLWDVSSRERLTFGMETRQTTHAGYGERFADGTEQEDNAPFHVNSIFLQNEFQLTHAIAFVSGLRYDHQSASRRALSPRLALVASPDDRTNIKLLYGEAFRAPSPSEADITTTLYTENPDLRPERIRTLELEAQRRFGRPLMLGVSVYRNEMSNLIDQVNSTTGIQFPNLSRAKASGIEIGANILSGAPVSANATFALQRALTKPTDERLTNSPARIATASLTTRIVEDLRSTLSLRHESGRRTIAGTETPDFVRTDLGATYVGTSQRWRGARPDVSLRVSNLFGKGHFAPAGFEHAQVMIPQAGRAARLQLDWHF
jgi:outer membrane receptor for ferrienterochelin and colicin